MNLANCSRQLLFKQETRIAVMLSTNDRILRFPSALAAHTSDSLDRSESSPDFILTDNTTRSNISFGFIKCGMQCLAFLIVQAISAAGEHFVERHKFNDFAIRQIRWFVELEPTLFDVCFDSQHTAQDIASRGSMPVVGAATQGRPGLGGSREGPKPGLAAARGGGSSLLDDARMSAATRPRRHNPPDYDAEEWSKDHV